MGTNASDYMDLLDGFREAAKNTRNPSPQIANQWHDKMHAFYKILRQTKGGRDGITSLLDDNDAYVRCSAAARCLEWEPKSARLALEALRDNNGECAFDAEMVLQEFDKGRLTFDY